MLNDLVLPVEEDDLRWLVEDEWLSIGRIGGGGGEQMLSGSGGGGGGGGTSPEGLFSAVLPLCTLLLDRREASSLCAILL